MVVKKSIGVKQMFAKFIYSAPYPLLIITFSAIGTVIVWGLVSLLLL